jgi:hypothetical protein
MELLIVLVLIGLMASLPMMIYTRRLQGKDAHTMGAGMGDIKFGENLGQQHWRQLNALPEQERNR